MIERTYETPSGVIHYWISESINPAQHTLILLPGLTADHRLFQKQLEYFEGKYNLFVWDAPGHASSWPFELNFTLYDKAVWLHEILEKEALPNIVLIGQSMGGYVSQMYLELYSDHPKGFISIDSAPLQKKYVTGIETWLLKRMQPVYYAYPWRALVVAGTKGVAQSRYGRHLMYKMMKEYEGDKKRYAALCGHGYKMLAEAMEVDLPYEIPCPALLICGGKDQAGSTKRYNKAWHKQTGIPIKWIEKAGHNSNTDAPKTVNRCIEKFIRSL